MRPEPGGQRRTWTASVFAALVFAHPARADIDDRALLQFARPAAPVPRSGPVDPIEWERRLRAPDRYGPPWLRPSDAALLAAARAERWPEALRLIKTGQASPNVRDEAWGKKDRKQQAIACEQIHTLKRRLRKMAATA